MRRIKARLDGNFSENKVLDIERIKESSDTEIEISLNKETYLSPGDYVYFNRRVVDDLLLYDYIQERRFKVKSIGNDGLSIRIDCPNREVITLSDVENLEEEKKDEGSFAGRFNFLENINITQSDISILSDSDEKLELAVYGGSSGHDKFQELFIRFPDNDIDDDFKKPGIEMLDDKIPPSSINCNGLTIGIEDKYKNLRCKFSGMDFIYKSNNGTYNFYDEKNTSVYYKFNSIGIQGALQCNYDTNVDQNDLIGTYYVDRLVEDSIPEIIDMEKVAFEPFYYSDNGKKPAKKITFNLNFRERTNTGWTTDDNLYWYNNKEKFASDNLTDMNFDLDDIRYQKNKLKMSFLRLSFYDTNRPFTQQLLYYSTIFFDTKRALMKLLDNEKAGRKETTSREYKETVSGGIDCHFEVSDKYDMEKSSEGFYLYLFPSLLKELEGNKIFMKVEFNHAGVGKTIPLIWNNGGLPPKSFTKKNVSSLYVDMNEYFDKLYIPLELCETDGKYAYVFPKKEGANNVYYSPGDENDSGKVADDNIILNLFEPRLNGSKEDAQ